LSEGWNRHDLRSTHPRGERPVILGGANELARFTG
jgi:hypothetical protein